MSKTCVNYKLHYAGFSKAMAVIIILFKYLKISLTGIAPCEVTLFSIVISLVQLDSLSPKARDSQQNHLSRLNSY